MSRRVLVTGAAGFIGYHLSERLLQQGDEVVGLDNLNDYYEVSLKEARLSRLQKSQKFQFLKTDLGDRIGRGDEGSKGGAGGGGGSDACGGGAGGAGGG